MLFGLNTVSVLTLIDVPVCFPLLLQTESTHKSGYYRLGGVRRKNSPFCSFSHTIRYYAFSSFLGSEKDGERKQRWTDRKRKTKKKETRESERIWEYMVDDSREINKGRSQNQLNHHNWKHICHQAARWQVSPYWTGMFIMMLNNWNHKDKHIFFVGSGAELSTFKGTDPITSVLLVLIHVFSMSGTLVWNQWCMHCILLTGKYYSMLAPTTTTNTDNLCYYW